MKRGGRRSAVLLRAGMLVLLGIAAGLGARCGPPAEAVGGTLVYAAGLKPALNDPNLRGNEWNEATSLVYSRLYRVGLSGKIEPDLVERDEVSGDGRLWTLHLRRQAVWHDGRPLDSTDVRATLDEVFDPNAACDLDLNLPMVESFEYPDAHRVLIHLRHPAPLLAVPLSEIAILPARTADSPPASNATPGTGPFRFVSRDAGGTIHFARHEKFHLGAPSLERILLHEVPDDAERARAVASGEVDVAHVKPQHVGTLVSDEIRILRMSTGAWRGMPLNLRRPALEDRRVRRAIDLTLDREAILAEALPRGGAPAYQHLPPASWAFVPELDHPYRDVSRARSLLEEAGWRPGPGGLRRRQERGKVTPLTLRLIVWKDEAFRRTAAEIIRRQLRDVGIHVEIDLVDNVEYNRLAESMGDRYDGFIGGWGALLDPGDNLYKKFHSRGSQNHIGLADADLDRMMEEARAVSDPQAARRLYRRILERLREEAVFLPLAYPDYLFAVSHRVTGIEQAVVDSWYEFPRNAYLWGAKQRAVGSRYR